MSACWPLSTMPVFFTFFFTLRSRENSDGLVGRRLAQSGGLPSAHIDRNLPSFHCGWKHHGDVRQSLSIKDTLKRTEAAKTLAKQFGFIAQSCG
jgi:hypothetical protein